MHEYYYYHGTELNNTQLYAIIGRPYICKWCTRSRVPEKRRGGILVTNDSWVETPLRYEEPRWVCIGCYIDVYVACNSLQYACNPDRVLVESIAQIERLSSDVFRRKVWEHQIFLIEKDRREGRSSQGSVGLELRLRRLLLGEA